MATTNDDAVRVQDTLVLGMGVGSFVIIFFFIVIVLVFLLSVPCTSNDKILSRIISTAIYAIIVIILFCAPRQSEYEYERYEPHHYDNSIIPRIAIASMMILFTVVAVVANIENSGESKATSTSEMEPTALWQH